MIEVTIKLRYTPDLSSEAYPACEDEADAMAYDKKSYETGFIDLSDLIDWADVRRADGLVVPNADGVDVEFAVIDAPPPSQDTHL